MTRYLIDTNVLVYACDAGTDPRKCALAREVVRAATRDDEGRLSTQVLTETFDVLARAGGESARHAAFEYVGRLSVAIPVLGVSAQSVLLAADLSVRHKLRIYDAMLVAAAMMHGVGVILSEDFSTGCEIDGVRFENPFAPGFDLSRFAGEAQH